MRDWVIKWRPFSLPSLAGELWELCLGAGGPAQPSRHVQWTASQVPAACRGNRFLGVGRRDWFILRPPETHWTRPPFSPVIIPFPAIRRPDWMGWGCDVKARKKKRARVCSVFCFCWKNSAWWALLRLDNILLMFLVNYDMLVFVCQSKMLSLTLCSS
jgi:hypothetical protein